MGKQGSPRSPRPEFQGARVISGMKDHKITSSDPPSWKRVNGVDCRWHSKTLLLHGLRSDSSKYNSCRGLYVGKKHLWLQKHIKTIAVMFGLLACLFLLDSLVISFSEFENLQPSTASNNSSGFQVWVNHPMLVSTLLDVNCEQLSSEISNFTSCGSKFPNHLMKL